MDFYVYIYYDPSRNNEPIYVGKGKNGRAWSHLRLQVHSPFVSRLKNMLSNGINPVVGIYGNIDEEFAIFLEEESISKFGRKDLGKGPLLNLTNGGDGISGAKLGPRPDDVKRKISEGNSGKKLSDEHKRKLSIAKKGKPLGAMPDEVRKKISLSNLGKARNKKDE